MVEHAAMEHKVTLNTITVPKQTRVPVGEPLFHAVRHQADTPIIDAEEGLNHRLILDGCCDDTAGDSQQAHQQPGKAAGGSLSDSPQPLGPKGPVGVVEWRPNDGDSVLGSKLRNTPVRFEAAVEENDVPQFSGEGRYEVHLTAQLSEVIGRFVG
jgi:hypothetical protein